MTSPIDATPNHLTYAFGGAPAARRIATGRVWQLRTEAVFKGDQPSEAHTPQLRARHSAACPVTGPLHVVGAHSGDVLAVHLVELLPTREWGFSAAPDIKESRAITTDIERHELQYLGTVYSINLASSTVTYKAKHSKFEQELPMEPSLGVVGVAPPGASSVSTNAVGSHGGNIATSTLRRGSTLYLPVFHPGALLALGGGRARKGDGTSGAEAVEVPLDVSFAVAAMSAASISMPRIETNTAIGSVGSGATLDDAWEMSSEDLRKWVCSLTSLSAGDSRQLLAQTCRVEVGSGEGRARTVVTSVNKGFLRGVTPFDDMHGQLRDLATHARIVGAPDEHKR